MNCLKNEELLALYVEGDLVADETSRLEDHLASCETCRGFLEGLRASQAALKSLRGPAVADSALEEIRRGVSRRIDREVQGRRFRMIPLPLPQAFRLPLAAALLLAAAGAALLLWFAGPSPAPPPVAIKAPATAERARPVETAAKEPPPGPVEKESAPPQAPEPRRPPQAAFKPEAPKETGAQEIALNLLAAPSEQEPAVIRLQTDDPDVVIYWIVKNTGGGT